MAGLLQVSAHLATLGAAKIALPTTPPEAWKQYVEHYAKSSLAVVASAAPSELRPRIEWELELLATMEPEHPLVLLIPPRRRKAALDFSGRVLRTVLPFLRPKAAEATPTGWDAFCDHVRNREWKRFDGARQLNPTGATHLIVYVPGEGCEVGSRTAHRVDLRDLHQAGYGVRRGILEAHPGSGALHSHPASDSRDGQERYPPHVRRDGDRTGLGRRHHSPVHAITNVTHRSADVYLSIASLALWYWTAQRCRRGNRLGRVMAAVFFALGCVATVPQLFGTAGVLAHAGTLAVIAAGLASVVPLWHPASKPHFTPNADNLGPSVDVNEIVDALKRPAGSRVADVNHPGWTSAAPGSQDQPSNLAGQYHQHGYQARYGAYPDPGASHDGGWPEQPPAYQDLVTVAIIGGAFSLPGILLGLIARRHSRHVRSSWESGDQNEAFRASRSALLWAIAAIAFDVVGVPLLIVFIVLYSRPSFRRADRRLSLCPTRREMSQSGNGSPRHRV